MKKILSLLFVGLFVSLGNATVIPPADSRGQSLYTTDFVGTLPSSVDNSTGTAAIIINSTGTNGTSVGGAVLYGIITSSIAYGDYITFKDTTGVGNISGYLAPQSTLTTTSLSTICVITNSYQTILSSSNWIPPYPQTNLILLPKPIEFKNGIMVQVSAAPQSNQGVSRWTILWRPLNTTQSPLGN